MGPKRRVGRKVIVPKSIPPPRWSLAPTLPAVYQEVPEAGPSVFRVPAEPPPKAAKVSRAEKAKAARAAKAKAERARQRAAAKAAKKERMELLDIKIAAVRASLKETTEVVQKLEREAEEEERGSMPPAPQPSTLEYVEDPKLKFSRRQKKKEEDEDDDSDGEDEEEMEDDEGEEDEEDDDDDEGEGDSSSSSSDEDDSSDEEEEKKDQGKSEKKDEVENKEEDKVKNKGEDKVENKEDEQDEEELLALSWTVPPPWQNTLQKTLIPESPWTFTWPAPVTPRDLSPSPMMWLPTSPLHDPVLMPRPTSSPLIPISLEELELDPMIFSMSWLSYSPPPDPVLFPRATSPPAPSVHAELDAMWSMSQFTLSPPRDSVLIPKATPSPVPESPWTASWSAPPTLPAPYVQEELDSTWSMSRFTLSPPRDSVLIPKATPSPVPESPWTPSWSAPPTLPAPSVQEELDSMWSMSRLTHSPPRDSVLIPKATPSPVPESLCTPTWSAPPTPVTPLAFSPSPVMWFSSSSSADPVFLPRATSTPEPYAEADLDEMWSMLLTHSPLPDELKPQALPPPVSTVQSKRKPTLLSMPSLTSSPPLDPELMPMAIPPPEPESLRTPTWSAPPSPLTPLAFSPSPMWFLPSPLASPELIPRATSPPEPSAQAELEPMLLSMPSLKSSPPLDSVTTSEATLGPWTYEPIESTPKKSMSMKKSRLPVEMLSIVPPPKPSCKPRTNPMERSKVLSILKLLKPETTPPSLPRKAMQPTQVLDPMMQPNPRFKVVSLKKGERGMATQANKVQFTVTTEPGMTTIIELQETSHPTAITSPPPMMPPKPRFKVVELKKGKQEKATNANKALVTNTSEPGMSTIIELQKTSPPMTPPKPRFKVVALRKGKKKATKATQTSTPVTITPEPGKTTIEVQETSHPTAITSPPPMMPQKPRFKVVSLKKGKQEKATKKNNALASQPALRALQPKPITPQLMVLPPNMPRFMLTPTQLLSPVTTVTPLMILPIDLETPAAAGSRIIIEFVVNPMAAPTMSKSAITLIPMTPTSPTDPMATRPRLDLPKVTLPPGTVLTPVTARFMKMSGGKLRPLYGGVTKRPKTKIMSKTALRPMKQIKKKPVEQLSQKIKMTRTSLLKKLPKTKSGITSQLKISTLRRLTA